MKIARNILETIGNTPLIELEKWVDPATMARVLLKAEHLEPSGSLKDRMALKIINDAEENGTLKPGGTVVEATAGNTGLALAMVCAVKGYKSIFVMPDKFSVEKINMLKAYGSEIITTPTAVPDEHPDSWKEVAKRVVSQTPGALLVNQFYNEVNVMAHYESTGPEIWEQTDGKIDVFISGAGSGGTISGAGRYLKEKAKEAGRDIKIILMDPVGSVYYDAFYNTGKKQKVGWKLEGIGNDFIPGALDLSVVDEVRKVSDKTAFFYARKLAREQGLLVGDTSGAGVGLSLEIAREIGPGKVIVCFLCDSGNRYVSKLYNDEWMKSNGFGTLGLELREGSVSDILKFKGSDVQFAGAEDSISNVVKIMSEKGISQMPLSGNTSGSDLRMVHESDIMEALLSGESRPTDQVGSLAKSLEGKVRLQDDIAMVEPLLDANNVAVVVGDNGAICGIITRIDVVRFLAESVK
ncbi:MAG TPA: pyridoxal-phosphate dependent enzyme [Oligoflexia bacterium]|nr:pyridoxal-phosphate dependent enzyme [Oligoflexia bacterium]HMP49298.1 pyridoxal-phosphate dependent enzyme [Oligoflexia bacterium]